MQPRPPAVSSRAAASTAQMQRLPRSETYRVLPSGLSARPAAPATPPSTFSTVRAAGSYTYTQPVAVCASSSVRRALSSPFSAPAAAATAKYTLPAGLTSTADTAPSGAPSSWVTTCSTAAPQLSCLARHKVPPAVVNWVSHTSPAASKAKPVSSPSTLRMAAACPPSVRTRSLVRFFRAAPFHAAAYKRPSFARMQSTP